MANMHLVTGYAGQEHITALDQGAFNAAMIGRDQFVLKVGGNLQAQVISNNQIRILDGELMMQGRFVRLDPDTYVDLNIENGAQGMKRNDLIVARYTKNASTGVEAVDLVVIKGTAAASDPADPAFTEADMRDGTTALHDFPLWRIPLDGLNVGTPVALFGEPFMDSMRTLPEMRRTVNEIFENVERLSELLELMKADDANRTKIVTGSYTGTGQYGSSNPNVLSVGFKPMILILRKPNVYGDGYSSSGNDCWVFTRDFASGSLAYHYSSNKSGTITFNWGDDSVSWYASGSSDGLATGQFNNGIYYYAIIGLGG
jgi:hypothetical protein